MVNVDSLFSGNYLKTSDFDKEKEVEIKSVKVEFFGREEDAERKAVVYFEGIERGLVLNKVNAESLKEISGSAETDVWIGLKVLIYTDKNVMFSGQRVGGLRIKPLPEDIKGKAWLSLSSFFFYFFGVIWYGDFFHAPENCKLFPIDEAGQRVIGVFVIGLCAELISVKVVNKVFLNN